MHFRSRTRNATKVALFFVVACVVLSASAQQKTRLGQSKFPVNSRVASACGPASVGFKVNIDSGRHGPLPAQPGKAMAYFIHDAGIPFERVAFGYPTRLYRFRSTPCNPSHSRMIRKSQNDRQDMPIKKWGREPPEPEIVLENLDRI